MAKKPNLPKTDPGINQGAIDGLIIAAEKNIDVSQAFNSLMDKMSRRQLEQTLDRITAIVKGGGSVTESYVHNAVMYWNRTDIEEKKSLFDNYPVLVEMANYILKRLEHTKRPHGLNFQVAALRLIIEKPKVLDTLSVTARNEFFGELLSADGESIRKRWNRSVHQYEAVYKRLDHFYITFPDRRKKG